ncbi:AvrD family protein [Arthrobacter sp. CJ23]|uniref:AvrD family protein n=1 Tax=Arthrobacter sp. CJ23 TaxID=2972479 RepID=UPI00215C3E2C|nr:AvrD family protein [Arthrobacter sp. CJ23]UVJ39028.1 AvrD family protein [Arthrobacter sp. CJ23]
MPLALRSATERYASIDELLGDGRRRFFSHGYKSTNPRLHELRVAHTVSESTLTARAGLGVEGVWSVKGDSAQTPHLGTTDVLVLACRMAEALLASRYSPELLPKAYLQSVTISGGSEPVEGALGHLDCQATLQDVGDGSSVLRCSVASMNAVLQLAHAPAELGLASVQSPSEDALVGESGTRLYGGLWAERQVSLLDVVLEPDDGTACALLSFRQQPSLGHPLVRRRGLEAAYPQALSAVEYFVATLQLGQVLLYRLDAMNRADSNTLWMRKTRITFSGPGPKAAGGHGTGLAVRLQKSRLIVKDGEPWRCADVVGTFDGGEVVCSVAHQLPTGAGQ